MWFQFKHEAYTKNTSNRGKDSNNLLMFAIMKRVFDTYLHTNTSWLEVKWPKGGNYQCLNSCNYQQTYTKNTLWYHLVECVTSFALDEDYPFRLGSWQTGTNYRSK